MKRKDLRFCVGSNGGARAGIWRLWAKREQVYLSQRSLGGIKKLSFHSELICRDAFTSEHGVPATMKERAVRQWKRAITPDGGASAASLVGMIGFPTDYLSTTAERSEKHIAWIDAAPAGMTTVIELMFTRDDEASFRKVAQVGARKVIEYIDLENGEAFAIASNISELQEQDFVMPASHSHNQDLVISASDPLKTGRPVRVTTYKYPKDGDALMAWEFGGYWAAPNQPENALLNRFSRTKVLDGKWNIHGSGSMP